jgi:hypothetical protein
VFRGQVDIGFVPRGPPPREVCTDIDVNMIKCVLCAGLYPNIGKLLRPRKAGEPACFETRDRLKIFVHPVSSHHRAPLGCSLPTLSPYSRVAHLP